ncbi:MAG: hypothetical protein KGI41_03555 [Patescibacteria group bacterium]|nr:hypothetical protein [Patescibacteria group bacterium]
MSHEVIIIAGAPGSGKSALAKQLADRYESPDIDFGKLREFHLDTGWKKQSPDEEGMAFESLLFIIRNYLAHGYRPVIVHDLRDNRVKDVAEAFKDSIVFTLVPDDGTLEERINARTSGWRDIPGAIVWNNRVKERAPLPNEHRIDNASRSPEETLREAVALLG